MAGEEDGGSMKSHVRSVGLMGGVLVFGVVGWAAFTGISGAVVAHGQVVAANYVKKVQHQSGGVVKLLAVKEGQAVREGQTLLRLDDTQVEANLAVVRSERLLLTARRARLLAEQAAATGAPAPGFSAGGDPDLAPLMVAEQRLMIARRVLRERQKAQLSQQITGVRRQTEGLTAQAASHQAQIGLVNDELKGVRSLYEEGYAPIGTLKGLERQAEALSGERGQLTASAAQATNRAAELRSQILAIDAQHLAEVLTELRDVEGRLTEATEKEAAISDQLRHVEIKAPQTGVIHQLTAHTVGGVIAPGESIMLIVPNDNALSVDAKIAPQDITQVAVGRTARLKFSALNQRSTPEISGRVSRVSADLEQDQRTGAGFYVARVELAPQEVARLGKVRLTPGMPVEVFVQTGQRTVLSYLLKPLHDQVERAFTER